MESIAVKRSRNRKKKRLSKKRRREQAKETKFEKRRRILSGREGFVIQRKLFASTMQADSLQADSFWKNYTAAQEWQKRHSVTWWRSRCFALEYENQILRDKLRSLAYRGTRRSSPVVQKDEYYEEDDEAEEEETESNEGSESIEFHVDQDMMNFLEQSVRHKIELRQQKESETIAAEQEEKDKQLNIHGGAAWVKARNINAKLLYGKASPTILAMETALQTTVDRHKDKAKPQYWPVIPLKP